MRKGPPNRDVRTLIVFVLIACFSVAGKAQPLVCVDQVTVSLMADCRAPLSPQLALTDGDFDPDNYRVRVGYPGGGVSENEVIQEGQFDFIVLGPDDFVCRGQVTAEDKAPPTIDSVWFRADTLDLWCTEIEQIYNNPASIDPGEAFFTGRVYYSDGCDPNPQLSLSDQLEYGTCVDTFFARLDRTFTITDQHGQTTDTTQVIFFRQPDPLDAQLPAEQTIHTCEPDTLDTEQILEPYWINAFGDTVSLSDADCNLSINRSIDTFPVCDRLVKLEVYYEFFDWCANASFPLDTILVYAGDTKAPSIQKSRDSITFSTGPFDCTGVLDVSNQALRDAYGWRVTDCGSVTTDLRVASYLPDGGAPGFPAPDSSWQEVNYPRTGNMISEIPVGLHALYIDLEDDCGNRTADTLYFDVLDQVAPRAVCVEDLNVSLSTGGFARAFATEIDEGSSDNCSPVSIAVRRQVPDVCIGFLLINGYDQNGDNRLDEDDGFSVVDGQLWTPWAGDVPFLCCDLGAPVRVELRVTDESGNASICWLAVQVEDKRPPLCRAPADIEVSCQDERLENLSLFGSASILQNDCGNITIEELTPIDALDQCGIGLITRQFRAIRDAGTPNEKQSGLCLQEIRVVPDYQYRVCFPADVVAACESDPTIAGVKIVEEGCDLIAVSEEDEYFYGTEEPGVCYKIFRTYQIINWCEYNGEDQPVLVSRDWDDWNGTNPAQPDGNDQPGDRGICVIVQRDFSDPFPDTVWYDADPDPFNGFPKNTGNGAEDGYYWRVISGNANPASPTYYTGNGTVWGNDPNDQGAGDDDDEAYGSNGYWQYTQHISVYDTTRPELTLDPATPDTFSAISSRDCEAEVSLFFNLNDECNLNFDDFTFSTELDLYANGVVEEKPFLDLALFPRLMLGGRYPIGTHELILTADDGCGNRSEIRQRFTVVDRKAPGPICINGLTVELMRTEPGDSLGPAAAPVFVDNFLASDMTDCSGDISYSMNIKGDGFQPDRDGVVLTCSDIGTVVVEIFAWDPAGNVGSCETYVLVQDNDERLCRSADMGSISGLITTPDLIPLEGAEVALSGPFDRRQVTGTDGAFGFFNLAPDYDYSVSPKLDRDYVNGVSTYDLYLIQQHILGLEPFTEAHQYVAADANRSGFVSVSDMVQLRKLILNIDLDLEDNTSWRFMPVGLTFNHPQDAIRLGFAGSYNVNNLPNDSLIADFTAIKIGDISGDAQANSVEIRSDPQALSVALEVPDRPVEAGNTYAIPVIWSGQTDIRSLQFALELTDDQATILEVREGVLRPGEFARLPSAITASWLPDALASAKKDTLLTLRIRANQSGSIAELLTISERHTPAEGRDAYGQPWQPKLVFTEQEPAPLVANARLFPNPASGPVTLAYELHQAGIVTWRIYDAFGRLLSQKEERQTAGAYQREIPTASLSQNGRYQVQLVTGDFMQEWPLIVTRNH